MTAQYASPWDSSQWRHVRGSKEGPAGVTYTGKKAYTYKDPTSGKRKRIAPGEHLSRRQYENLRYRSNGWESKSEYERVARRMRPLNMKDGKRHVHEADAYQTWAKIYADEHNTKIPKGPANDYSRAFAAAYHNKFKDISSDSPFAHLLSIVGLRDESWQWDVGDTPSSK